MTTAQVAGRPGPALCRVANSVDLETQYRWRTEKNETTQSYIAQLVGVCAQLNQSATPSRQTLRLRRRRARTSQAT